MKYLPIFCFRPSQVECVSCVSYFPLCVRALSQICVGCVNRNKFEHVRIFASPLKPSNPCVHCVTNLPLYVSHCAKIAQYRRNKRKAKNAYSGS